MARQYSDQIESDPKISRVKISGVKISGVKIHKVMSVLNPTATLGDHSERVPPVPIPNTEVKPLSPDCTARAGVWETRKSPD